MGVRLIAFFIQCLSYLLKAQTSDVMPKSFCPARHHPASLGRNISCFSGFPHQRVRSNSGRRHLFWLTVSGAHSPSWWERHGVDTTLGGAGLLVASDMLVGLEAENLNRKQRSDGVALMKSEGPPSSHLLPLTRASLLKALPTVS